MTTTASPSRLLTNTACLGLLAGAAIACPFHLDVGEAQPGLIASLSDADILAVLAERERGWEAEAFLTDHVQLTFADEFYKAGEAYFSPDSDWIIFQAVPTPPQGEAPSEHYDMYVARINRDSSGAVTGLGDSILLSEPGSANTCGWFHPTEPGVVLFGSTIVPPAGDERPGYSREGSRYTWAFPTEMEIVTRTVKEIVEAEVRDPAKRAALLSRPDLHRGVPLFDREGYDAEGSWSPDGRSILYTAVDAETGDGDLWVYHVETGEKLPIVTEPGYDGGPFFSADGKYITYRSDRRDDNLLQLFVAELDFDSRGLPVGIKAEHALTDNGDVNWCPFWHPSGRYLVYATSSVGHQNYEVFAIPFNKDQPDRQPEPVRVTHATGFDGLPVFNATGSHMMWTAQRGADEINAGRASSQLWIARVAASSPFSAGTTRSEPAIRPVPGAAPAPAAAAPPKNNFRFGVKPGNYTDPEPGVVCEYVSRGTAAFYAGMLPGDRMMTWNDIEIQSVGHWSELLGQHKVGDVVKVGVRRDGQMLVLPVELTAN